MLWKLTLLSVTLKSKCKIYTEKCKFTDKSVQIKTCYCGNNTLPQLDWPSHYLLDDPRMKCKLLN